MANPATLESLRDRSKQRTDKVNSTFLSTAEWNELVNQAWTELYGLLVTNYADYYTTSSNVTATTSVEYTALPTDFFKFRAAFPLDGTTRQQRLRRMEIEDLGAASYPWLAYPQNLYGYTLSAGRIYWHPMPTATSTVQLWYIPQCTRLVLDEDTISAQVVDGWDEYIVNDVSMKVRLKEEGDASPHAQLKQAFVQRLLQESSSRDAGMPGRVMDVERRASWPSEEWSL